MQRRIRSPATPDEPHPSDRFIPRCEEIPSSPEPGDYVVVDTMYFSTTVVELLENGAAYVHVTERRGDEIAFKREYPDARIGGDRMRGYEPAEGYDFFNSPSYVQSLDVEGRPVAMTSTNGGRAVDALRDADGVSVYVGGPTNATALANHLDSTERPTYLVSAGSRGFIATEDHIGATIIGRRLAGDPLSDRERDRFRRGIELAKGRQYKYSHPIRQRDVEDFATSIDTRTVIPRLEGDRLVDVSTPESAVGTEADTV